MPALITYEELTTLFSYDESDSAKPLVRKTTTSPNAKQGMRAGGFDKSNGYYNVYINKNKYKLHRLVWLYKTGSWPKDQIDHINRNRSDNRFSNLRDVTNAGNKKNTTRRKDNTTGVTGVTYFKDCKMWRARINVDNKRVSLGLFQDKESAAIARAEAEKKYGYSSGHGSPKN